MKSIQFAGSKTKVTRFVSAGAICCLLATLVSCSGGGRPETTRALRQFLDDESRAEDVLTTAYYGHRYQGHEFLRSSADSEGVRLQYRYRWDDRETSVIEFKCDRGGMVQDIQVLSTTPSVGIEPFSVANLGRAFGKGLLDGLNDQDNQVADARSAQVGRLRAAQRQSGFPMADEGVGGFGLGLLVLAVAFLLLVGLVGGGIYLLTRGRSKPAPMYPAAAFAGFPPQAPLYPGYAPPTMPIQPPAPAPQMGLALYAMSGPLAGSRFPIDSMGLAIGRDPQLSQLLFRVDDRMISKRHCTVRADLSRRGILLEDCGSTNGTYLESGERTATGVPQLLTPGAVFYLGDREHAFQVREG